MMRRKAGRGRLEIAQSAGFYAQTDNCISAFDSTRDGFASTSDGLRLIRAFMAIQDPGGRAAAIDCVEQISRGKGLERRP